MRAIILTPPIFNRRLPHVFHEIISKRVHSHLLITADYSRRVSLFARALDTVDTGIFSQSREI